MAHVVNTIRLSKLDTLPGTKLCPADLDCDGGMVVVRDDGSLSVAVWVIDNDGRPSIHYSYKVDARNNYILGSARYSGETLEALLLGMKRPPAEQS